MATSLPNFENFHIYQDNENVGTRWRKWLTKFENLVCALDITTDARKKALLLHYGGDEIYEIYESFSEEKKGIGATADGEPNEYNVLKKSFTDYFTPKKNTSYERLKFRNVTQNAGETIDSFHTRLRALAVNCDFHDVDSEILTQILHSCTSSRLRRRALRESFTLDQILSEARSQELSEARATDIEQTAHSHKVNAVKNSAGRKHGRGGGQGQPSHTNNREGQSGFQQRGRGGFSQRGRGSSRPPRQNTTCRNCGGTFPHPDGCPAVGKQCRACSKVGHYSRVCRSKQKPVKINSVSNAGGKSTDSSSEESVFHVTHCSKIPAVHATLFGKETSFLVDSGATVNIVHTSTCPTNLKLKQPCPRIMAYGSDKPLPVDGYFSTDLEYKGKRTHATFYVVNSDKKTENLLCADTAHALGLIQFAFSASLNTDPSAQSTSSIADNFTELFDGKLGHIKGTKIKLHVDPEVQPVAQQHRRIPFHLQKQAEAELKKLQDLDIIEPVTGPTPWVSPIVCVPKKRGGEVRVCVDMREPNKAIGREKHPMPTLDDLIADLNGATVFSKLDMTQAYHQLEIDEDSSDHHILDSRWIVQIQEAVIWS